MHIFTEAVGYPKTVVFVYYAYCASVRGFFLGENPMKASMMLRRAEVH